MAKLVLNDLVKKKYETDHPVMQEMWLEFKHALETNSTNFEEGSNERGLHHKL